MKLFDIFTTKRQAESLKTLLLLESISNISKVVEEERNKQLKEKYDLVTTEKNKLEKLGLTQTQNYREVKELHKDLSKESHLLNPINSAEFISYIKLIEEIFPGSFLVSYKSFYKLLHKYNLWIDSIKNYRGVIPEENLSTIYTVNEKLEELNEKYCNWDDANFLYSCVKITDEKKRYRDFFHTLGSWRGKKLRMAIVNGIEYDDNNTIRQLNYLHNIVNKYLGIFPIPVNSSTIKVYKYDDYPEILDTSKAYRYDAIKVEEIKNKTLLIACPKKYLVNEGEIKISKRPVDPIVFQTTPYGVLIHSVWGEEAEDKVLADYMRVNNLIKEM